MRGRPNTTVVLVKAAMVKLARFDDRGQRICFASKETIAKVAGVCERSVTRAWKHPDLLGDWECVGNYLPNGREVKTLVWRCRPGVLRLPRPTSVTRRASHRTPSSSSPFSPSAREGYDEGSTVPRDPRCARSRGRARSPVYELPMEAIREAVAFLDGLDCPIVGEEGYGDDRTEVTLCLEASRNRLSAEQVEFATDQLWRKVHGVDAIDRRLADWEPVENPGGYLVGIFQMIGRRENLADEAAREAVAEAEAALGVELDVFGRSILRRHALRCLAAGGERGQVVRAVVTAIRRDRFHLVEHFFLDQQLLATGLLDRPLTPDEILAMNWSVAA